MIPYQIRSIQLINLVRDLNNQSLIPDAYFQRNLVWREIHNKDLIETILLGYPFPLIFISKGEIDVETMTSKSCIVDGQQRCNAIRSFVADGFKVRGKYFSEFSNEEKTAFFKYEIPVCEVDVLNTDSEVLEMFKRINRTSNSLTNIEKMASEYGSTYFMLVAKLITNQIDMSKAQDDSDLTINPNIPDDFMTWAQTQKVSHIQKLLISDKIFSATDIARKVNLQYALNLMCTYLDGFYDRNEKIEITLNLYKNEFDNKDIMIHNFEKVAKFYLDLKLPKQSMWSKKANFFSLFIFISDLISRNVPLEISNFKEKLDMFEPDDEYKIYSREGVNNLKERKERNKALREYFLGE